MAICILRVFSVGADAWIPSSSKGNRKQLRCCDSREDNSSECAGGDPVLSTFLGVAYVGSESVTMDI